MAGLLALLPLATLAFTAVALRPRDPSIPYRHRLAIVRAAVAVAVGAVLSVELLSLAGAIATWPVVTLWVLATAATGWLAWRRRPADWQIPWPPMYLAIPVAVLVAAELVLALASAPNNFDSNSYHLPKIEHWIANGDLRNYATLQTQQIILVPGAEFLLLHLRLLTGGDGLFHLLQWGAGLLGAVAVSRSAAQLGAGRVGQWLAAAVFLTAPAVVLESTSTQNDLVVVAWVACAATLALDGSTRTVDVLTLAGAAGLAAVTKSTGLMALAAVLLFWGIAQLRRRAILRTAAFSGLVIAAMLLLAGPSLLRVHDAFGSPLGPAEYRTSLSVERHDPPAILVNALRLGASTLLTPVPAVNRAVGDAVVGVADLVRVDPNDPAITQWRSIFPGTRWKPDEDRSPYPIQSALVLAALAVGLFTRRTRPYALLVLGAFVLTAAVVKWQDWGNRLILPAFALAVPLAGVWLGDLAQRSAAKRKVVAAGVALVTAAAFAYAYGCVALGQPRRLVGHGSVFTLTEWEQRFARMPENAGAYRSAIDEVKASGARRIGLVIEGDLWEYPFQLEFHDRELVSVVSAVPTAPPADATSVDAVICVSSVAVCRQAVPGSWRYRQIDPLVATAFPAD